MPEPTVVIQIPPSSGLHTFSGTDSEDPEVFLLKFQDYLLMHKKDPEKADDLPEIKKRIQYALSGKARTWYKEYLDAHEAGFTWKDFQESFKKKFNTLGSTREVRLKKWRTLNWDPSKTSIQEYADYITKLGESLGYAKADILEMLKLTVEDELYPHIMSLESIENCVQVIRRWTDKRGRTASSDSKAANTASETIYINQLDLEGDTKTTGILKRPTVKLDRVTVLEDDLASLEEKIEKLEIKSQHSKGRGNFKQNNRYANNTRFSRDKSNDRKRGQTYFRDGPNNRNGFRRDSRSYYRNNYRNDRYRSNSGYRNGYRRNKYGEGYYRNDRDSGYRGYRGDNRRDRSRDRYRNEGYAGERSRFNSGDRRQSIRPDRSRDRSRERSNSGYRYRNRDESHERSRETNRDSYYGSDIDRTYYEDPVADFEEDSNPVNSLLDEELLNLGNLKD